jgi:ESCRT-II complex subunit VPS22
LVPNDHTHTYISTQILGIGSFYFELAVQIVHVCLATREANGGLMDMSDMVAYLGRIRSRKSAAAVGQRGDGAAATVVSTDDVKRAVGKLSVLGNGIRLLQVGMRKVVVSVPTELSHDHTSLMQVSNECCLSVMDHASVVCFCCGFGLNASSLARMSY